MSKHTPGPWLQADAFGPASDGRAVQAASDKWLICECTGYYGRDGAIANARLIAAAPELYEALNGIVGLCALLLANDLPHHVRDALENNQRVLAARAALAKAEAA